MSFAITAIALTIGTTAVSAYGQQQAGKAQEIAYKEQAKQEEFAAEAEELARRQELNKALAQNAVAQSLSNISAEGTPQSLAINTAEIAGLSEATIDVSNRMRRAALQRAGRNARRAADIGTAATLLKGGASVAIQGADYLADLKASSTPPAGSEG